MEKEREKEEKKRTHPPQLVPLLQLLRMIQLFTGISAELPALTAAWSWKPFSFFLKSAFLQNLTQCHSLFLLERWTVRSMQRLQRAKGQRGTTSHLVVGHKRCLAWTASGHRSLQHRAAPVYKQSDSNTAETICHLRNCGFLIFHQEYAKPELHFFSPYVAKLKISLRRSKLEL